MANVVVTAASVVPITGTTNNTNIGQGIAGAAITAGQELYMDSTASNQLKPADATSLAKATVVGNALNNAAVGQPVQYAISGDETFGSGLTKGSVYVLSATPGGGNICPWTDLVSGNYVTIVGVGTAAGTLRRCNGGATAAGQTI